MPIIVTHDFSLLVVVGEALKPHDARLRGFWRAMMISGRYATGRRYGSVCGSER